ncbi:MAG: hypothetical protein AAF790_09060 [Planctomycetota bacterium]
MTAITFKRARRNKSGSREWQSRCGGYLVTASEWCYGVRLRPVRYTAWRRDDGIWRRISRHRSKPAAVGACRRNWRGLRPQRAKQ